MSHRSHLCTVVVDVPADAHGSAAAFWGSATGTDITELDEPQFHGARLHETLVLLVQRLGTGDARVHLDIHTDDVAAEVARLEALGATVQERHEQWTIMVDPAGLPFCVVEAPPGSLEVPGVRTWP